MCGIVGYIGKKDAFPILIKGLRRLEYRGYDSAGVALINGEGELNVYKSKGKVDNLCEYCGDMDYSTMTRKTTKRTVALIEDIAVILYGQCFPLREEAGRIFVKRSIGAQRCRNHVDHRQSKDHCAECK